MRADAEAAQVRLAAWRQSGADRFDPARFRFMEALVARAARHEGAARRLLDARLARLLDEYAASLAQHAADGPRDPRPCASAGGALAPLLAQLAVARQDRGGADAEGRPLLPALADFRRLWSDMLGERRLRQSLAPQPADAGPLNSSVLVHRAIAHMRATSPDYLHHFLAYADHLCWLERLHEARLPALPQQAGPVARRAAARKPRKRKQ